MIGRSREREFEAFARRAADNLVRTAYVLCGDHGHAEDLVQTTLLRTARRWSVARSHPEAYARRVLVNLVKNRWRDVSRRPRETTLERPDGSVLDVPATPDRAGFGAVGLDDGEPLLDAIRGLPRGQQAVLALRFLDDLSIEQTASLLQCSTGTVKSQTHRALAALRNALPDRPETTTCAGSGRGGAS